MELKNTKVLKKRGRKPKDYIPEPIDEIKIKKKRGRKPKCEKTINENNDTIENPVIKVHKKRGRKPKLNKIQLENKNADNISNIILHLPINDNLTNLQPQAYDNVNVYKEFKQNPEKNIEDTNIDFNKYIKYREEIFNNKNILFYEFIYSNKKNKWPTKTNIDCLWDCHPFTNMPFGIPIKKENNKTYLFGNFCSPECAAAYCFDKNDNIWDKYSLLNELYSIDKPIKIANSKLLLKKFGGIYNIDEYRSLNINNSKTYSICLPPIISSIPTLEETIIDINEDMMITKNSVKKINKYKLKRSKPFNDKNTLENIMNLKYL
jgi:hypothetical protein